MSTALLYVLYLPNVACLMCRAKKKKKSNGNLNLEQTNKQNPPPGITKKRLCAGMRWFIRHFDKAVFHKMESQTVHLSHMT